MDSISDFIIRPPRSTYEKDDLGPSLFRLGDGRAQCFQRQDFELLSMRGLSFPCSWFKPCPAQRLPCVVYCHANCGGRDNALECLFLLEKGFSLFCFDFCGCGQAEGEYISLGFYERQDLAAVIEFLMMKSDEVDGVALWGRSMGAVAAIMYASKDPWVRCIVCDSPFASLRRLISDLVQKQGGLTARALSGILQRGAVELIRRRIMRRASFDIDDLDAVKYASQCRVPALLFHGSDDDFVSPKHCEAIRDAFLNPCLQMFTPGGHNDERGEDIQRMIVAFLRLYLIDKPQGERERQAAVSASAVASSNNSASCASALPTHSNLKPTSMRRMMVPNSLPNSTAASAVGGSASPHSSALHGSAHPT